MAEEYSTLLHRWMEEVWNKKRDSAIDEMFAENGVAHGLPGADGEPLRGPDGFRVLHRSFITAFPDLRTEIENSTIRDDHIWARIRVTATHTGEGFGEITNQPVEFTGMVIVRLEDGKIAEAWNEIDFASLNAQIEAARADQWCNHGEYETFLHRWFGEAWNKGREDAIDEMVDPDVKAYGLTGPDGSAVSGREGFRQFFRQFRSAFPDLHVDIIETINEGDKIGAVCRVSVTHRGDGLGFAATHNSAEFEGVLMVKLRDGKIAEAWNYFDFMSLFGQLGVLAMNPPAPADQSDIA